MNQRFLGGLTAALMMASLGHVLPSQASELTVSEDQIGEDAPESVSPLSGEVAAPNGASETSAVKVGEYQSEEQLDSLDESIATIYAHQMDGRYAATLYVRDIPVLTALGNSVGDKQSSEASPESAKVGRPASADALQQTAIAQAESSIDYAQDPVWRATAIAARLNQAHRDQVDPGTITARWDSELEAFIIELDDEPLVTIDGRVIPPDTTGNEAEDTLQMANRIRRQLGAEPLSEVEGMPEPVQQVALGPVRLRFSGMASWYGPGFHGRRSASGEVFNQHALTAAHPSLPFGTLLQVTNTNTGSTVTVRVNDRGPYAGHRVLDLSAAAAQAIGMLRSGVAPVRVEVLGQTRNR
ncbi:MAG: septal ring lytic transglycosylase RlpA family protein [Elainellaceae cyanobacterium]